MHTYLTLKSDIRVLGHPKEFGGVRGGQLVNVLATQTEAPFKRGVILVRAREGGVNFDGM